MKKILIVILLLIFMVMGFAACKKDGTLSITFIADGVTISTAEIQKGEQIADLPSPQKEGHSFAGWYMDANLSTRFVASAKIEDGITLYAKFSKNEYDVTFVAEGQQNIVKKVLYQSALTDIPSVPSKTGHTGVWSVTNFSSITQNITVNAVYTPIELTITFKADGFADITRTVDYGSSLTTFPAVPAKVGKTGVWENKNFSNIIQNFAVNAIYSDIMLEIKFVSSLGDELFEETLYVAYGQSLPIASRPQPTSFVGHSGVWEDVSYTNLTQNLTVNATYTPFYYTVIVYDYNNIQIFDESVPYGTILATYIENSTTLTQQEKNELLVEDAIKAKLAPNHLDIIENPLNRNFRYGNSLADVFSQITQNHDFELLYDQIVYVTFELNGGELSNIELDTQKRYELNAGEIMPYPILGERYGYKFLGWFADADGMITYDFYNAIMDDTTVVALWEELFCEINFPAINGITFSHNYTEKIKYGEDFSFEISSSFQILEVRTNATILTPESNIYAILTIEEDINLAVKTDAIDIFMLVFRDEFESEVLYTRSVSQGQPLQAIPTVPERTGGIGEWKIENAVFDFDQPINDNMSFIADYTFMNYSIQYIFDNTSEYRFITYGNTSFEFVSPQRKEGMLFDGWYLNPDLSGNRVTKEYIANSGKSLSLYPKWIAERSISHSGIIGTWFAQGMVLEFHTNGMVQISDAISYSNITYLECHFYINSTTNKIFIFDEEASYNTTNISFRGELLSNANNNRVTIIKYDDIATVTIEGAQLPIVGNTSQYYWYTDIAHTEIFDINEHLDLDAISNNILILYKSFSKTVKVFYNALDGYTDGNIAFQEITINSSGMYVDLDLVSASAQGKNFLGWAKEGTDFMVDKSFLFYSYSYNINLVAIYAEESHLPTEIIENEYSEINNDRIIIVKFFSNGTYQITIIDTNNLSYTKSVPFLYYFESGAFKDKNGNAIVLNNNSVSMTLDTGIITLEKRALVLPQQNVIYQMIVETDGQTDIFKVDFGDYQIKIGHYAPYTAYQFGDNYFYYFYTQNGINRLMLLDITTLEIIETNLPAEYLGSYQGIYDMYNPENDDYIAYDFTFEVFDDATAEWILYDDESQVLSSILWSISYDGQYYALSFYDDEAGTIGGWYIYYDDIKEKLFLVSIYEGIEIELTKLS